MANLKPSPSKELSMETRLLVAFLLMGAVLFLTPYFYAPNPASPKEKLANPPAASAAAGPSAPAASAPAPSVSPLAAAGPRAASPAMPLRAVAREEILDPIETDLYRIEFTNRGALVKSWVLKKYRDSNGKPLDLVSSEGVKRTGLPLAIHIRNQWDWPPVNNALFIAQHIDGGYEFEYSDGRTYAKKTIRTRPSSYLLEVTSELLIDGAPVPHLLTWRGGFGDSTVPSAAASNHTILYDLVENKLIVNKQDHAKNGPQYRSGNFAFAGFEDTYFALVALPPGGTPLELLTINDRIPNREGKEEPVVGGALGGSAHNRLTLFVGPKDYTLLKNIDPRLDNLVDFGWTTFIAKPLFLALKWVNDHWVRNWGWSIVLVTVIINILLLPLKLSSLQSMRKMALVSPEMQLINERYKGLPLNDPRMAQKNQEIMALYKKHGVNPAGGCLPLLLQFPFLFAFYAVLSVAIDLRQAQWLWIKDLSVLDPLYILPVLMVATQFVLQKMTPVTGGDPAQQRMLLLMPLIFGFMFLTAMSGLVLYWLTGNVVGIAQQWAFNKLMPAPAAVAPAVRNSPVKRKKA